MTSVPATAASRSTLRVPTAARTAGGTVVAALVAALVLGILGMHALATHGGPAPVAAAVPGADMVGVTSHDAATAPVAHHDAHDHATADASPAATGHGTPAGSGDHRGGMVMLCVVMLAATGLTFLVLLAVRVLRPLVPAAFRPAPTPQPSVRGVRGAGPPPVWQFSVIRC